MDDKKESSSATKKPEVKVPFGAKVMGVGLILFFCWIMIWGIAQIGAWFIEPSMSAPTQTAKTYSDVEAYVQAQEIIRGYLKSPATAVFPSMSNATIEDLGGGGFKVSGYVDSQNSFGALLRSDWEMVFQFIGDKVDISIVGMDGKLLYKKATVK